MSHGTGDLWLYKSQRDFQDFLELLLDVKNKYKFEFHTLILMLNHYHFIIETPFRNLSKGMNYFNGELAKRYNKRYKRKGAVFRSRYKAILIDQDNYYLNVYRYINQNALRIKIVDKVEEYQGGLWYYLEKGGKPRELITELINWSSVKSRLGISNIHKIKDWVNEELESSPHAGQKYAYLLGTPSWIEKIKKKYVDPLLLPKDFNQKHRIKKATSEIWKKFKKLKDYKNHPDHLNIVIYILWKYSNLNQSEIATKLNLSGSNSVCCR
ncbi:MAG: transposase, partial [bacterium]|nr:transposase [bacterium]